MKQNLDRFVKLFDKELKSYLVSRQSPNKEILNAMEYSTLTGGKRLRPYLAYLVAKSFGCLDFNVIQASVALEMIHCYSLVHDDLPAIDNDDTRRGIASCHIKFGEAMGILTGDALLTEAFFVLSRGDYIRNLSSASKLDLINCLSYYAGISGMISGQVIDINQKDSSPEELYMKDTLKTGKLIKASCDFGLILAGIEGQDREAINTFSDYLGVLYQVVDDIEDTDQDEVYNKTLSKTQGERPTVVTMYGLSEAKNIAKKFAYQAVKALDSIEADTEELEEVVYYILSKAVDLKNI